MHFSTKFLLQRLYIDNIYTSIMKKLEQIVNIYIIIFVTNILLITLFIGIYYVSPNNYTIVKNVSFVDEPSIVVKPGEQVQIMCLDKNVFSVSGQAVCIFKTIFKTQQLVLEPDIWIKPNVGSDGIFYIRNNSEKKIDVRTGTVSKHLS